MTDVRENVPLAPFTTIGIGGPARYFIRTANVDEVSEALHWASQRSLPVFILGGGSNLLISDAGFPGLVIHVDLRGRVVESEDRYATVKVAAGEPWDSFVEIAARNGWAGIECLSGIPGSTGATPIQNVGAYGQDVSETVIRVEALDRTTGRIVTFTNAECRFGYRASLFKNHEPGRHIVLQVTFRLERGGSASIRYPELQRYLDEHEVATADLIGVRQAVIAIRKRKGMVIDPADPDTRSDGSFFMNPIVRAGELGDFGGPSFPAGEGLVKLSAAWLIENAGFQKGFAHGNSSKHSLAIINRGGGTAAEVRELVEMIQSRVRERFGVELHPEPNFIGF
jgi:UDP-N-acetylmuramate dehydrogenase